MTNLGPEYPAILIGRFTRRMEVATVVLAVAVGAFLYVQIAQPFAYRPLRNPSPQRVSVAIVEQGGALHVTAEKCNDGDGPVPISGESWWVRESPQPRMVVPHMSGGGMRYPGCSIFEFENLIPATLPVGTWRLEGIEVARSGSRMQQVGWYTENFEVISGRRNN